ncbi:MAG TPA: hypothetical protein VIO32_04860 [Candidatus Baltobacteraceae bacterium]
MSDDFRRRRRINTPRPARRSRGNGINPWMLTIVAAIVVIAGGWFLGQALAHVFNGSQKNEQVAQAPTITPPVTALPSPSPAATQTPVPSPSAAPTATATPAASATPKPAPKLSASAAPTAPPATATPAATQKPTPAQTATPVASAPPRRILPVGRRPEPTATPAAAAEGSAARVVRAYIDALRRGDPATASSYLGNGVPDESFITPSTRISNVSETRNADGSYKVEVDMMTGQSEYYETFTVASDKILEKTSIKP